MDVAEAFRSHVILLVDLAIASVSGDVAQSARQSEALKNICACFEQLPKVNRLPHPPESSLEGCIFHLRPVHVELQNLYARDFVKHQHWRYELLLSNSPSFQLSKAEPSQKGHALLT